MIKKLSYLLAALLLAFAAPALAEPHTYQYADAAGMFGQFKPMQEYKGEREPQFWGTVDGYANGNIYVAWFVDWAEGGVFYTYYDAEKFFAAIEPFKQGDFATIVGAEAYFALDENGQYYMAIRPGKNTRKSDEELADEALDTMEAYSESFHRLNDVIEEALKVMEEVYNDDPESLYKSRLNDDNPEYFPMCSKALSEWFKTHPAELRNYRNHFRKKYFKERNKELGEWYKEHREELEADREIFGKKYFQDIK